MSTITLYAELLVNIHQVTVFATLPSKQNETTVFELSSDRITLTLKHDGQHATVVLPGVVASSAILDVPKSGDKSLFLRLQASPESDSAAARGHRFSSKVPWSASSLSAKTRIACSFCEAVIVDGTVNTWKDLPSENWAEMMEFWHCHKPSDESRHPVEPFKGYSAAERIHTKPGVALVDTCHIIVAAGDCKDIYDGRSRNRTVSCIQCQAPLGLEDPLLEGIRLDKWSLALGTTNHATWERYSAQIFVSAQLLELLDSQATRKFVAYSGSIAEAREGLLLWVFNPEMRYSTSKTSGAFGRAMKILYRSISDPELILKQHILSVEGLRLSPSVLSEIHAELDETNTLLPESARTVQVWQAGFLDRY